jgi:hypothetical protein
MHPTSLVTALLAIAFGAWLAARTGNGLGAFAVGYTAATWTGHAIFRIHHRDTHRHALIIAGAALLLIPGIRRRLI